MSNEAAPLPIHKQVLAGAIAGVTEIMFAYPTDVVKTRIQLLSGSTSGQLTLVCRDIYRKEGVLGFYRGITSPILAEAPKRAFKFTANENYKQLFKGTDAKLSTAAAFMSGSLAGMTETLINCPFEVIKVRMQSKEAAVLYKGTVDCLSQTVRSEGFLGLYNGAVAQICRNGVWSGTYFGLIHMLRDTQSQLIAHPLLRDFVYGSIAGLFAVTGSTPFDVVKSRMQSPDNAKLSPTTPRLSTFGTLFHIYKHEGLKACYKGYIPRVARLGPGGGIMLIVFTKCSEWFA